MQQENATQTGAENLQPAHAGRNAALAQIAKQVDASYQEDMNPFDESTGAVLPKQQATQQPVQTAQPEANEEDGGEQQEEQQAEQQPVAQTKPEDDVETIVVQGQQVQVKKSQLLDAGRRTLQKEATADKRLQEATEMLRQAQAYAMSLRQSAQPSQDAGQNTQSPSEQDATNRSGQANQSQATPDLRALVKHELWLTNAESAAQRFRTEFKDIAEDPMLMRLAAQLEDERLATAESTGEPLGDPWEAYKKHGETIRQKFGKPQSVQPAVSEDRQERKRSTTTVVGSGARMQQTSTPKPLSTSERIENMRIARMGKAIPIART